MSEEKEGTVVDFPGGKNDQINGQVEGMLHLYNSHTQNGNTSLLGMVKLTNQLRAVPKEDRETVVSRFEARVKAQRGEIKSHDPEERV